MTPRHFVESLRYSGQRAATSAERDKIRLEEIEGWLWANKIWNEWGEAGRAFVLKAEAALKAGQFIQWLDKLPPTKDPYPVHLMTRAQAVVRSPLLEHSPPRA
jgi:hypothetical protein